MKDVAIFTIVSNNYFSRAITLMDSIINNKIESDNFIVLVDEKNEKINYESDNFKMIYLNEINCKKLEEMKFKYDVVEFNTSVKPFVMRDLFDKGYKKAFYIDPDICLYSNIDELLNILDEKSIVLTPHTVLPNMLEGEMSFNEVETSATGAYNLGFCGFKNSAVGYKAVSWWCNKLQDYCYTDFKFGLFYDQKWMNFMPCFFPEDTKVLLKPGYNLAPWNFHERTVEQDATGKLIVKDMDGNSSDLVFIHFSGFDPHSKEYVIQKHIFDIHTPECILPLCKEYADSILKNQYDVTSVIPYAYNKYDNGDNVTTLHRQIYRKLIKEGYHFDNLFTTGKNTYHALMKKSKLINNEKEVIKMKNVSDFDAKAKKVNKVLKIGKKLMGVRRWQMFMRYMQYAARFDNQDFLVNMKGVEKDEKNS